MKVSRYVIYLTFAGLLGATGPAHAGEVMQNTGATQWAESRSSWYLRGDISYNFNGRQESGYDYDSGSGDLFTFDYEDAIGISAGFGQYITDNLRWDITLEHVLEASEDGSNSVLFDGVDENLMAYVKVDGDEVIETSTSITNVMGNAYFDLGRFGAFTPYAGIGLGVANIRSSEKRTHICNPTPNIYCLIPPGGTGEQATEVVVDEERDVWVMSYGFTAGASVDIGPNTKLDFAYQYLNIGDGPKIGGESNVDGLTTHRIKAGLRWDL